MPHTEQQRKLDQNPPLAWRLGDTFHWCDKSARPTEHQRILIEKLELRLPTRIRVGKMVWKRKR